MVAEVIVDVGDQDIEDHAAVEFSRILFGLGAVLGQDIDEFGITSPFAILQTHHGQSRQEGDAGLALPVETPG